MGVVMVRAECCVRCGFRSKEREDFIFVGDKEDAYFDTNGDPYCIKCATIDGYLR